MTRRERILLWVWAISLVALAASVFTSAVLAKWTGLLETATAARLVLAGALFVAAVWVALKVLLFFYVRRRIRFITFVASFVMWLTGSLTIGAWLTFSVKFYIPKYAAGTISAGEATALSCIALVAGLATLAFLVWQFPLDRGSAPTAAASGP